MLQLSTDSPYLRSVVPELALYGGQFTLSGYLIKLNYLVINPHHRSTTVSLGTYPFIYHSITSYFAHDVCYHESKLFLRKI